MSLRIVELVNSIKPVSYLELGYWDGANHKAVDCPDKVSVDTNGKAIFTGTTDEFFAQNKRRFDVTFIDACHCIDFVKRDWNNAIACTDHAIILHDMIPPTRRHCAKAECSDSYLLLNHFIDRGIEYRSLDHDCGLTVMLAKDFETVTDEVEFIGYYDFLEKVRTCKFEELKQYARK